MTATEEICPEKADLFKTTSLLGKRVGFGILGLWKQLKNKTKNFGWFGLALDETTDVSGSWLLAVGLALDETTDVSGSWLLFLFNRGVNPNFEVTEELASMNSMWYARNKHRLGYFQKG
jgi:hypothetical protein